MKVARQADEVVDVGTEQETARLAAGVAELIGPGAVLGLVGTLGAGKTRFARALAEALGVAPESVASPTFVLIHEYEGRLPVFHFDTYRLRSPAEFDALGASDYWDAGGVCVVEWADRIADRLPDDAWMVGIDTTGPTARRFHFRFPPGSDFAARLAAALGPFDAVRGET